MKIAEGELRQILTHDLKLTTDTVRELVADSRQSGHPLLKTALASKKVSDTQIAKAYAKRLVLPFIDLEQAPIDPKMVARLPRQIASRYQVICFDETATSIKLAMSDPRSEQARKAVRDYAGKTVRRYLATDAGLAHGMRAYPKAEHTPLPLSTRELLATLLDQAWRNGSRDVHFEPQASDLLIKRRVGTRLQTMSTLPLAKYRPLIGWCKLRIGADVADTERPHHGRFSLRIGGVIHDVVVSTLPTLNGEKMVLRLVPPTDSIPGLVTIGYGARGIAALEDLIADGRGLILIAGGNNAEVPTTLASLALKATKQPNTTITTIEEPIHYQIDGATQVEVTHALPLSDIVAAVIAQNPSTLVISNLGKGAAAEQLVDFALSQHLVIGGLYATSLRSAISQLVNYPIAPALTAASLRLIVVQHQIDRLCKKCRTSFAPTGPLKKVLQEQFGFDDNARLYRKGRGCDSCHLGHDGTTLAAEWLASTHDLQQLLATGADAQTIDAYIAANSDYVQQLGKLAANGLISIDEATKRAA